MNNLLLGLKFAFSYFSILPGFLSSKDDLSKKEILGFMLFFLPLVGATISLITVLIAKILPDGVFFTLFSSVIYMMLSGFLHLEAVVDVIDAIYAKHSGKDAYIVIKEPTVGAIGVFWGVSFFILKLVGVAYLLYHDRFFEFIMIAVLSRVGVIFVIYIYSFKSIFLNTLKQSLSIWMVVFYGVLFLKYIVSVVVPLGVMKILRKQLGFLNGDTVGFSLEVYEIFLIGVFIA